MSALGQKQTLSDISAMSALQKRTSLNVSDVSAKCQQQTHLVGARRAFLLGDDGFVVGASDECISGRVVKCAAISFPFRIKKPAEAGRVS